MDFDLVFSVARLFVVAFCIQHVVAGSGIPGQALSDLKDTSNPLQGLPDRVLHHHLGGIYALAFGQDDLLATGARDYSIALWNLTKGYAGHSRKPMRTIDSHRGGITALAFGYGSFSKYEEPVQLLLSGSADNTTRIWNARTGKELSTLSHPKTVFGIAVSPQRERNGLEEECILEFVTGCWDGKLRIFAWPGTQPQAELSGHDGGIYAVAFSPLDATLLASASADRTVRIWDLARRELLWTLRGHRDHVTSVDWSPTEAFTFASGGWDRRFHLWQLRRDDVEACRSALQNCSQRIFPRFSGKHPQLVWRVAFAPGGDKVAACHGAVGQSPTVLVYDVSTGQVVRRLGRHKDTPLAVVWSFDGSLLASAGMDKQVLVYDGMSQLSDVQQGDVDDLEEQMQWRHDLDDYLMGRVNETNSSSADANIAEDGPRLPHPLGGRVAYF